MTISSRTRPVNALLARLPAESLASLLPQLTTVELVTRQVIYAAGAPVEVVYFPEAGILSMVTDLEDGMRAEVGLIGREGMVGGSVAVGVGTSFNECLVQVPGSALRIGAAAFRAEMEANLPLRSLLLRYGEAIGAQVAQTAACNGRHDLEQRLARWLLMAHDRTEGDELPLSQEFLATMLGVHRPSVTLTAGLLQRAGLIRHGGGRVTVLNRASLEASACECYRTVRQRTELVLGPTAAYEA